MNKIIFCFCNLITIIGIGILFITNIINKVLPMLGKAAFQSAMAGSYAPDDYIIDFSAINLFASGLIVVGVIAGYFIYKKEFSS